MHKLQIPLPLKLLSFFFHVEINKFGNYQSNMTTDIEVDEDFYKQLPELLYYQI